MTQNALMTMKDTVPDVKTAVEAWTAYMKLCGKHGILNQTDYQKIWVKEKDENGNWVTVEREFKKKSAWQKLARAFNVDTTIVSREIQRTKTGRIQEAYYCVRATLPNGRSVESDALCNRHEKGKAKIKDHDIMSIAKTRATNRAIAELIGAGEVTAEEITPTEPTTIKSKPREDNLIPAKTVEDNSQEDIFVSAGDIGEPNPEDDPVHITCLRIKEILENEGKLVTKSTMRSKVIKLIKDGDIPEKNRPDLIDYIDKHCPEELY